MNLDSATSSLPHPLPRSVTPSRDVDDALDAAGVPPTDRRGSLTAAQRIDWLALAQERATHEADRAATIVLALEIKELRKVVRELRAERDGSGLVKRLREAVGVAEAAEAKLLAIEAILHPPT